MIRVIRFITDNGREFDSYGESYNDERFNMGLVKVCSNSDCDALDLPDGGRSCERCGQEGVDPEPCSKHRLGSMQEQGVPTTDIIESEMKKAYLNDPNIPELIRKCKKCGFVEYF